MQSRFYYTVDGSRSAELKPAIRPPRAYIRNLLSLLIPGERSTLMLAPIPPEKTFIDFHHEGGSTAFLQCAGTAEAMTIEWHRVDDDGQDRHYIVGRGGDHSGEPDVEIPFFNGTRTATVYPDEVFALDEATDTFFSYYETETLPPSYATRLFDLAWPKPQS